MHSSILFNNHLIVFPMHSHSLVCGLHLWVILSSRYTPHFQLRKWDGNLPLRSGFPRQSGLFHNLILLEHNSIARVSKSAVEMLMPQELSTLFVLSCTEAVVGF